MAKKKRKLNHGSKRTPSPKVESPVKLKGSFLSGREGVILFSLVVLAFLVYSNTLELPFVFDDLSNIRHNPDIRLTNLTLEGIKNASLQESSNRPVANISFALNYYFHQYHVLGYHLVNILIHAAAGIFLYLLVKTTINLPSLGSKYGSHKWIPLFTVLIWLVHPIQTQSVTYIVQRMNSMAAMFYVLSLLLYARARLCPEGENKRKWSLFSGCLLSGLLAIGTKEIAATLPIFIFLYEWYFFQDLSWTWLRRQLLPLAGLLILLVILAWVYLGSQPLERLSIVTGERDFTIPQRVLTELRVVIFYISLLVLPHPSRLNLDHDFPISHSLIDPMTTLLSLALIAGLIGLALAAAGKERLLSFCILWFLGNLVIESSIVGIELLYEHRIYLPSMMVSMLAVLLIYRHVRPKWLGVGVLCVVVMMFSLWTYDRNGIWVDGVTLWTDSVMKSPKKARPHYNLGVALKGQGRFKEAKSHYLESLRINPGYAEPHNNLGVVLMREGNVEEAIVHFSKAVQIDTRYRDARSNLGVALAKQGNLDEAVNHYRAALRIMPDDVEIHHNLGNALTRQGKFEEAAKYFADALRIRPDDARAHYSLSAILARQGKFKEARKHYSAALRIKHNDPELHNNLGMALVSEGKLEEAVKHFSDALQIRPDYAEVRLSLERALRLLEKKK